ncbi:AsnC family transcriptional regulator [Methanohalophilus profundi]|uniref:AsnC family transcriptional regulator n=1 Tax=Methanohalophilus profundi TaxID=2138083 RepID=UPI0021F07392|nr:AsnC family transcriptional regulator [Methanohalophilus profundi]
MIRLDEMDKRILNEIQLEFPLSVNPYAVLAERIGIPEEELLKRLERLNNEGALRRIGPVINTRKIGGTSTLIALKAPDSQTHEIGEIINKHPEVSHNYLRPAEYNIWFTISAADRERLDTIINQIVDETGCPILDLPTKTSFQDRSEIRCPINLILFPVKSWK